VDGARRVQPAVQGEVARYRGVRPNSDLELSAITAGVKERIVLQSASADDVAVSHCARSAATPVWDEASKSVRFLDRRGNIAAVIPPGSWWTRRSTSAQVGRRAHRASRTRWFHRAAAGR
jgi:hypothetical protein